ncbi:MAG: CRISPR-associated helicase Cas3' [Armatimonadetes bacterium CG_4_10_14_3_um_filter_66_18]|nr:CRISPR-associated helicase Cas3' [Armatimonadota bacterium]NCP30362.1 CRISPR-associated helicase Cas3' [Armatimonadota bacterium]PIY49696.1 MAG: CRISPR-associated helicase Cas3' [Armatimonadetes bacterium CG_4_10_14_3_um_filter_66_18]
MQPLDQFHAITGFEPNPMQAAMWERVGADDCAVLLKSPTGSGKTEAVLAPSLATVLRPDEAKRRRLFMVYPARSLVEDQIGRISGMFTRLSQDGRRLSLVVDTGGQSKRRLFEGGREVTESQYNPRRHLYDGDVIVTTLDKFLYRFFGFGEERKSFIFPFRVFHGLRRNLFVFDEAHAYDDTAFTNFVRLLKALYTAGLDTVVMTATMPQEYAQELDFLQVVDHLGSASTHPKTLRYVPKLDNQTLPEALLAAARPRCGDGKRVIVSVESVAEAVTVWEALQKPLLYHGRIDGPQRRKVYDELKRRELDDERYTLVTTSAIEVGCDLDADCLVTELCNPASLVQRAGRCNRRGKRTDAEVVVVGNRIPAYVRELTDDQERLFLEAIRERDGAPFRPDDFLPLMKRGVTFDYRAEILFDMLFEYVYEARLENKPLHDKGLVVTRSWEPSVTLTTDRERMSHAVSVPLSRCATVPDKVAEDCRVFCRYFNRHGNEYEIAFKELHYGGCAYFRDLVIEAALPDVERGWVEIPKPFIRGYREGYRETLRYRPRDSQGEAREARLFYLRWQPEEQTAASPVEQSPS